MNIINYKCESTGQFSLKEKQEFLALLRLQGKVINPTLARIENYKALCTGTINGEIVSIGAIKPKSKSDFSVNKANLPNLSNDFAWEIGYFYTAPDNVRNGYGTSILELLIDKCSDINLMATTEIRPNNSMINILRNAGFSDQGSSWKSGISGEIIRLFLNYI